MVLEARRDFLKKTLATGLYAATYSAVSRAAVQPGIPGPFPGRVIAVESASAVIERKYQRAAVRGMLSKGLMELTGASSPQEAWRYFFQPGDVVGLKLNPVGSPFVMSAPEVVIEIVEGLKMAGLPTKNVVAFDRYRDQFIKAGFDKWLPEGVRWSAASDYYNSDPLQLDMQGYDASQYIEMPLVLPEADAKNPHHRRSYLSNFISKDVNKMINLCLLKHHQSAGVTIALKNLSHGLVNNVSRSHSSPTLNTCGTFIPNIVDHPMIRQKVVLNICDGVLAAYHGGPGSTVGKYMWEHKTMYFSTDPVALDKTGLKVIDAKRTQVGMLPIATAKPDKDSTFLNMQVEHIEIAGALGLGEFDDKKIEVRRFEI
ncbi:MAG TPA: DUF362 domain-containing protein [Bryobacteraceae bacterium]|nr:DUF362 domain-containing protein [Bryobacteraceae bacterium]